VQAIRHGLELDSSLPIGHRALSYALLVTGRCDEALIAAERGVALSPGDALALAFLSLAQTAMGRYAAALASIDRAIGLSPLAPGFFQGVAASPLYALDRFDEAVRNATEASFRSPSYLMAYVMAAASCVALGRRDEASTWISDLLQRSTKFSLALPRVANAYRRDQSMTVRFSQHLRVAGLPG